MESKMKLVAMSEGCPVNLPCLRLYHPNGKGTGCAMAMALRPADAAQDGFVVVSFANQMAVGNPTGDNPTFPKFDWDNRVDVVLDFYDLCAILQVLRGDVFLLKFGKHILSLSSTFFFDTPCFVGLTMAWSAIVTTRIELHAASGFD